MGTALDRAQEMLAAVEGFGADPYELPTKRYAALAPGVADCESVVITALSVSPYLDPNAETGMFRCPPPQLVTISGFIARECEGGIDGSGFTNVAEYVAASEKLQADQDILWEAVFSMKNYLGPSEITGSWAVEGGIWMASIMFTIGVL